MAHDVFVSYSSEDRPIADAVVAALEANGVRCWVAPRDITPGVDWGGAIVDAINASKLMVLVFSSRANASNQIKREVERAVHHDVTIVPFRIEDVPPSKNLEYFISSPHWLNAVKPPLDAHLAHLVETARRLIGETDGPADAPPAPAPAPVAPLPYRSDATERRRATALWVIAAAVLAIAVALGAMLAYRMMERAASPQANPATLPGGPVTPAAVAPTPAAARPQPAAAEHILEVFEELGRVDAKLGVVNRAAGRAGGPATATAGSAQAAPVWGEGREITYDRVRGLVYDELPRMTIRSGMFDPDSSFGYQLVRGGADPGLVREFGAALRGVGEAVDALRTALLDAALLNRLATSAGQYNLERLPGGEDLKYIDASVALAVEDVRNRCALAHGAGLRVLANVRRQLPADTDQRLAALQFVEPRTLPSDEQAAALTDRLLPVRAELLQKSEAMAEARRKLREAAAADLAAQVPEPHRPLPTDGPDAVISKARAARAAAGPRAGIAAYACYAERFADPHDERAENHATAAMRFTAQMKDLGLDGGLYLSEPGGGFADESWRGVVLTRYGGQPVRTPEELRAAAKDKPAGEPVPVEVFYFDQKKGRFERAAPRNVPGGPAGATFLPV